MSLIQLKLNHLFSTSVNCERCEWLSISADGMMNRKNIIDNQNFKELRSRYRKILTQVEKNNEEKREVMEFVMNSHKFLSDIKDGTLKSFSKSLTTQRKTIKMLPNRGDEQLMNEFKTLLLKENELLNGIEKYFSDCISAFLEKQKQIIRKLDLNYEQVLKEEKEEINEFYLFERKNFSGIIRRNSI